MSACWLSKPDVLGAHLSGAGLKSCGAWCEIQTLHPSGRSSTFWVPSQLWIDIARVGLQQDCVSALPTCFSVAFLLFAQCEVVTPPVFRFSSLEIVPYVAVDLVYLWEVVSSRSFYFAILNWNLYFHQHFKEVTPLSYGFHISEEKSVILCLFSLWAMKIFFGLWFFSSPQIICLNVCLCGCVCM